ncbi:Fic family protein [Populibacterium corticicola]|uniref:Fic family protein n=1 Tax=Populibacterium corticicola TaxID=1812826 RepID=A0ABW5XHF2_9MICO
MSWSPEHPFNALPPLPPRGDVETRAVLKSTIEARAALAELNAAARQLANPAVVINAIPLLEAQASSQIENIVTTTDELFAATATSHALLEEASAAVRETLRYRSALRVGFDSLGSRPISTQTAVGICSQIRGHEVRVRDGEVYIGNPLTRERVYTPPSTPDVIQGLLDNWSLFVNSGARERSDIDDLDPVVRMALAHYQFEAIHPFTDGNGRTGRILNVLMLCDAQLLELPLLYLSREIIATKDEYYQRLLDVTQHGAWEEWLVYFVEQVRRSGERTLSLVQELTRLHEDLTTHTRTVTGTANADLASVLMEQPYARTKNVTDRCGVSRPTATRWMKSLVATGVLDEVKVGREVLYLNTRMLEVLSGIASLNE